MSGLRKSLVLLLLGLIVGMTPTVGAADWQRPRKDPEVVKEKDKPKQDNKDQGNDRKPKDEPKKRDDNRKKPYR